MTTCASSYLYQVQAFVFGDDAAAIETALAAAKGCEAAGDPYPERVLEQVRAAYAVLEVDAPEVAADFGPPAFEAPGS
ncbi:hypothetical protein RBB84_17345 [Rhodococcus sp. D-6]|uniref:Uncharacterized protein n=1 Tax=Rhodococcus sp. D-6 TaxID=1387842 RepID=A0AAU7UTD0_9NOCA|nr:hypothetical protein [Rhodococcus sp. HS-D2]